MVCEHVMKVCGCMWMSCKGVLITSLYVWEIQNTHERLKKAHKSVWMS